ncbi:MAG: HIT family protein [Labilithrix sp.]|nr:HIT family protein [Labilithrix sp.]MCW5811116.1 HIT family protein [Labilithrix sp.]
MPTVFTRIISGELPGRFVWEDARCVAFLSAHPLRTGHTLVVPREEIDHWLDMPAELNAHVMETARSTGRAIQRAFQPTKVGMLVAGLEVPHVHVHLVPIDDAHDLDFDRQQKDPDPKVMDEARDAIRKALEELGFSQVSRR